MSKLNCNCIANLNWVTKACGVFLLWAAAAVALPPSTLTTLYSFYGTNGECPYAGLIQATDGDFYGTTEEGGANNGYGTIFKITPIGTLTTLHTFENTDGAYPNAGLVQATDGNLYGTIRQGGANGYGTVFKLTLSGTLTTLHSFDGTDGAYPWAGLVQATDGNFYGTTGYLGAKGDGTVFRITPSGTLTTLHSFDGIDGANPYGVLLQDTDGNFYGTTSNGGNTNSQYCFHQGTCGTVFKITPSGTLTTLYNFCSQSDCTDGVNPDAGLVQGADRDFYGTTVFGGIVDACGDGWSCGTVFKLTSSGALTTLHSFVGRDGENPYAGLSQGTDGYLYGTTSAGGVYDYGAGTIFKITSSGALTTLYSFNGTDGQSPTAPLAQDTNGTFYGTTFYGGTFNTGSTFSLSVGLGPFVKTNPAAGKVGASVGILGTNLTGATGVKFNGTETAFRVVSSSFIEAKVPSGATTGKVTVRLPGVTLSSNVPFYVLR